ncbi:MAG: hypothetical protein JSR82_11865 [Verrucomicrobia bacterium]|nr:hypothetical protein [Verrucomicrobiota bacterium]
MTEPEDDLSALRGLSVHDTSPRAARALLRHAQAAQSGEESRLGAFVSRVVVPVGLAGTAILYLQWALRAVGH